MQSACVCKSSLLHESIVVAVRDDVATVPLVVAAAVDGHQLARRAHHDGARHRQNESRDAEGDGHRLRGFLHVISHYPQTGPQGDSRE
jgi:hypothetical protein